MDSKFLFVGHRGTRIKYDENTLEAFEIALEYGADYIELDIRRSKNEDLVVIHDASLERTTTGSGLIRSYNYSELKKFKTILRKRKIPLLKEVIEKFKTKLGYMIELKEDASWENAIKIIQNKNIVNNTIFSGRNLEILNLIKTYVPDIQVCYNITKGKDLTLNDFLNNNYRDKKLFNPDFISLKSNLIDNNFINKCHNNDIKALGWNFIEYRDPIEKVKDLINLDIDGILFDNYRNIRIIKDYIKKVN